MAHSIDRRSRWGCNIIVDEVTSAYLSFGKTLYLSSFITEHHARNSGKGTELLTVAKRLARKLRKNLELTASPFGMNKMPLDRLVKFYEKRGFKVVRRDEYTTHMVYEVSG